MPNPNLNLNHQPYCVPCCLLTQKISSSIAWVFAYSSDIEMAPTLCPFFFSRMTRRSWRGSGTRRSETLTSSVNKSERFTWADLSQQTRAINSLLVGSSVRLRAQPKARHRFNNPTLQRPGLIYFGASVPAPLTQVHATILLELSRAHGQICPGSSEPGEKRVRLPRACHGQRRWRRRQCRAGMLLHDVRGWRPRAHPGQRRPRRAGRRLHLPGERDPARGGQGREADGSLPPGAAPELAAVVGGEDALVDLIYGDIDEFGRVLEGAPIAPGVYATYVPN